jgi:hypothetical protein
MLENGVDGELVNAISGHISQKMREPILIRELASVMKPLRQLNQNMMSEIDL